MKDSRQTSLPANWDPALQREIQATVQDDCTPGEMDGLLQSAYPLIILRSAVSEAFICPQSEHYQMNGDPLFFRGKDRNLVVPLVVHLHKHAKAKVPCHLAPSTCYLGICRLTSPRGRMLALASLWSPNNTNLNHARAKLQFFSPR